MKGNYSEVKRKIQNIKKQAGFYDVVRDIVGFYDGVIWEDYQIKALQRIADAKYIELTKGLE